MGSECEGAMHQDLRKSVPNWRMRGIRALRGRRASRQEGRMAREPKHLCSGSRRAGEAVQAVRGAGQMGRSLMEFGFTGSALGGHR